MHTIVRITTVPLSLQFLLKGQLRFMQQNGFHVIAVSANGNEIESVQKQENCVHYVLPLSRKISPFLDVYCIVKLYFFLRKTQPTIVHSHTPKAGLVGMLAAYLAKVPLRLHTVAGLPWMVSSGYKRRILKMVEKITAFAAVKVFVNSNSLLAFMQQENIAPNKLAVLGKGSSNGIDINFFINNMVIQQQALALQQQTGFLASNAKIWLFVGRLVTDKGITELVEAFSKLALQFPYDQLWLVGNEEPDLDPLPPNCKAAIAAMPNIVAWGFRNDVRPFMAAANYFVFPSYREGFPNAPMQASLMDCGLIVSNINGCNEIVTHLQTGLLVQTHSVTDLLDKMQFARKNKAVMDELKVASKTHIVEHYSQQQVWNNLLSEYNKLIEE